MSSTASDLLTPAEYLELERKAEIKSEYINGRMYAMSGATLPHGLIVANLSRQIGNQLGGKDCRLVTNDLRVKVGPTGMYTYPDIVAYCGNPELEDTHLDTLLNPVMIVEVLSTSTEAYDRGVKFSHYRQLESLREYILVAQNRMSVEVYQRQGHQWVLSVFSTPNSIVKLTSIDCQVEVATIYKDVDLGI